MIDTPSTYTPLAVWVDWMMLYLDDLDQRLTVGERDALVTALEDRPESGRSLINLPKDLRSKTERLVAFLSDDRAPQKELTRLAASHLRQTAETELLIAR
jgi:hypothetical protein